jgi:uncharacterized membrane protein
MTFNPVAPFTELIDKTEDLLGHSPHPAIVALPIGAWAVSNVCDSLALITDDCRYDDAARTSMAIGLAGAAVAAVTGLRDYGFISPDKPSHEVATAHGLGNAVVGTLFATSYLLRARDQAAGRRTGLAARLLGLAGGGLALYTAWLGGVLVQEYGEAVKPVMEHEESDNGEEEPRGRERLTSGSPLGSHGE